MGQITNKNVTERSPLRNWSRGSVFLENLKPEDRVPRPTQPEYAALLHEFLRADTSRGDLFPPYILGGYEDAPALLVGQNDVFDAARSWLEEAGFVTCIEAHLGIAVDTICRRPSNWGLVIVAIDDFGGAGETINGLMKIRISAPHVPVILLSEESGQNDFSTERLEICDVTLAVPVAFSAFEFGLTEALVNNSEWQDRVEERFSPN